MFFVFSKDTKIRLSALLPVILVFLVLAACSRGKLPADNPRNESNVSRKTFTIALLPDRNVFAQKRRYRPLADYLSKKLGIEVKTRIIDSYEAVYNEMLTDKVQAAFFGALSYVAIADRVDLDLLVHPVRKNGSSTYQGVIFARRSGGITEDPHSWKGKRLALVSKSTTSGYLFPRWYLYKKGITNFEAWFGRVIYAGGHDAAVLAVLNNEADIGCSTSRAIKFLLEGDPSIANKLKILATSADFPSNSFAVRKGSLNEKEVSEMKEALLGLDRTEEGKRVLKALKIERFIQTIPEDYEPVRNMMADLQLRPDFFTLTEIGRGGRSRREETTGSR